MTNDLPVSTSEPSDNVHMRQALDEARESASRGDLGVGAVLVVEGQIVGSGGNEASSTGNPLAHAEIQALTDFFRRNPVAPLGQATLYTTFEPCPMCLGACMVAGLEKIVVGGSRETGDQQWGGYQPTAFAATVGSSGPRIIMRSGPLAEECTAVRSRSRPNINQQQTMCTAESEDEE